MNRRGFLIAAAVVVGGGLALRWRSRRAEQAPLHGSGADVLQPNAYLQITPLGQVILQVDKAELGQGVVTGFVTLLAEELDVSPESIEYRFAPVHPLFQDPVQLTGESKSMRSRFGPIRAVGATARRMLLSAAAARWAVAAETLDSDGSGAIVNPATGARLRYAELVEAAARLPVPDDVPLRTRDRFRYIGGAVRRPDIPAKVRGATEYGIDVRLPGLAVAVIHRPAQLRAPLTRLDDTAARALPGVIDVIPLAQGVAVLGESFWHARRGAEAIDADWGPGSAAGISSASVRAGQQARLAGSLPHQVRDDGDTAAAIAGASRTIEAEYWAPYLAHAPMEPMNATVWFHDGRCEAWIPNQGPDMARQVICDISGLRREQVTVNSTFAGGGFGRRATMEFVEEAATIAWRAKRPVKLIWTREDDLRHGLFREATTHRLRAGLDESGLPVAWEHKLIAASINQIVFPITAAVVAPEWVPDSLERGFVSVNVRFFDWLMGSYAAREPARGMAYDIPNVRVEMGIWDTGVPITIWRSVGHSYGSFVLESFIDELAAAAGRDPVELRRRLLTRQPRHLAVLELAAQQANWGRPPAGRFQGVAVQEAFGTLVAQVAEVSVDAGNAIRVHRVTCAVDCGLAINPDIVRQQIEGGIIFGLTAALHGEITLADGAVEQRNFNDYKLLTLPESPAIDVHIVPSDAEPSGIGEPGVPPIAPAVANAVFAATGRRLRELPLRL